MLAGLLVGEGGSVRERKELRQLGWAGAVSKTQADSALFFFIFIVG